MQRSDTNFDQFVSYRRLMAQEFITFLIFIRYKYYSEQICGFIYFRWLDARVDIALFQ